MNVFNKRVVHKSVIFPKFEKRKFLEIDFHDCIVGKMIGWEGVITKYLLSTEVRFRTKFSLETIGRIINFSVNYEQRL